RKSCKTAHEADLEHPRRSSVVLSAQDFKVGLVDMPFGAEFQAYARPAERDVGRQTRANGRPKGPLRCQLRDAFGADQEGPDADSEARTQRQLSASKRQRAKHEIRRGQGRGPLNG